MCVKYYSRCLINISFNIQNISQSLDMNSIFRRLKWDSGKLNWPTAFPLLLEDGALLLFAQFLSSFPLLYLLNLLPQTSWCFLTYNSVAFSYPVFSQIRCPRSNFLDQRKLCCLIRCSLVISIPLSIHLFTLMSMRLVNIIHYLRKYLSQLI